MVRELGSRESSTCMDETSTKELEGGSFDEGSCNIRNRESQALQGFCVGDLDAINVLGGKDPLTRERLIYLGHVTLW